jgi:hypothetical protein
MPIPFDEHPQPLLWPLPRPARATGPSPATHATGRGARNEGEGRRRSSHVTQGLSSSGPPLPSMPHPHRWSRSTLHRRALLGRLSLADRPMLAKRASLSINGDVSTPTRGQLAVGKARAVSPSALRQFRWSSVGGIGHKKWLPDREPHYRWSETLFWSGRRDSNPRPPPWQFCGGRLMPLTQSQQCLRAAPLRVKSLIRLTNSLE